jgi:Domain of unknown function (DUF4145)
VVCLVGHLALDDIKAVASARSLRGFNETNLPTELNGTFHGLLKCAAHSRREAVAVAGDNLVDYDARDDGRTVEFDFYRLRFALPALRIIVPPTRTPEAVTKAIDSAALIIWADPGAAANRLPFAIDELLTAYGRPRFQISNHKRHPLWTDQRIKDFAAVEPAAAEALEAVKWIGNQGSRSGNFSPSGRIGPRRSAAVSTSSRAARSRSMAAVARSACCYCPAR